MTRVYLVRHGETAPNKNGIALGRADVPLTEHGQWQAGRIADALGGLPVAAVFSSPLQRAVETARPVAERLGIAPEVREGLIEMDVGALDGLPYARMREEYADLLVEWMGPRCAEVLMPGGERLVDVAARSWDALGEIAAAHDGAEVVVVSHNFVILVTLARAAGLDISSFRKFRHEVGAVSIIELRDGAASILSMNDTCHLRTG
jgi:broad specificity phosphatase PhoE